VEWVTLSIRTPLGDHGGDAPLLETSRERRDFVLSEDLVYWRIWEICKRSPWKQATFSIGVPTGNLEGGLFTKDLERQ